MEAPAAVAAAGAREKVAGRAARAASRGGRRVATPLLLALLLAASLPGLPYYLAPAAIRLRHPLHAWLKPSGLIGQSAGILSLLLFLFLWLYPLRKRVPWLRGLGRLPAWLDVHIVAGLAVPIVGAIHAGWRFSGLIGLGYVSMLVVSLSGIVGRYLYGHIPRGLDGLELGRGQIEARKRELVARIARRLDLDEPRIAQELDAALVTPQPRGFVEAVGALAASDALRWLAVRRLRRGWARRGIGGALDRRELREVGRMIRREMALAQQLALLDATQSVFRFWHVAHLPVAVTALGAVLVHVAVVVALGVTWLW
jgi:hypothetical protein